VQSEKKFNPVHDHRNLAAVVVLTGADNSNAFEQARRAIEAMASSGPFDATCTPTGAHQQPTTPHRGNSTRGRGTGSNRSDLANLGTAFWKVVSFEATSSNEWPTFILSPWDILLEVEVL
jgi:hypothetical protein